MSQNEKSEQTLQVEDDSGTVVNKSPEPEVVSNCCCIGLMLCYVGFKDLCCCGMCKNGE